MKGGIRAGTKLIARTMTTAPCLPPPLLSGTPEPHPLSELRTLILAHADRVRRLAADDDRFVVSSEIDPFSRAGGPVPELILVGDNPGTNEKAYGEFLSRHGVSGRSARRFFDGALGVEGSFGTLVLVLNKSNWHTPRTAGLSAVMRSSDNPDLRARLVEDQEANGLLLARLSVALRIPVVTIGTESDEETFRPFREAVSRVSASLPSGAAFRKTSLPNAFRKVPHFSHSQVFRRNSDTDWNRRIDGYAARWAGCVPGLLTDKQNISSKVLLATGDRSMLEDYLLNVILGAG